MENKTVLGILISVLVIGFIVQGVMVANNRNDMEDTVIEFDVSEVRTIVREELAAVSGSSDLDVVGPTAAEIAAEINVESADNVLLNEFLESRPMFVEKIEDIEEEAEFYAVEELEDHNYRVIVDHLMSLVEGVDEDTIEVVVEDTEFKILALGLGEDEDKSARVTFEIEVDYKVRVESEYGYIIEDYSTDVVVVYDVVFEEGEFGDEEVELVSIV